MDNLLQLFSDFRSDLNTPSVHSFDFSSIQSPPKIIWFFWAQGLDHAPDVVHLSIKSWQAMNRDYRINVLDEKNVTDFFPYWQCLENSDLKLGYAHKADYLRLYLLRKYGGIWADVTTFCWKPISVWHQSHLAINGYFMPNQGPKTKDRCIKNWLIASSPNHPIISLLENKIHNYIFKRRDDSLKVKHIHGYKKMMRSSNYLDYNMKFIAKLESKGFYPYYYFHYIYNDIALFLKRQNSPLFALHERMIALKDLSPGSKKVAISEDVCFSKQSYRDAHINSAEYKMRQSGLLELLSNDFIV